MRIGVFSSKRYDRGYLTAAGPAHSLELLFLKSRLTEETAPLAGAAPVVCIFVSDLASRSVLERLAADGTQMLALRSAGFNHVDLDAAAELGITGARVPEYSPHAVAEFTVG